MGVALTAFDARSETYETGRDGEVLARRPLPARRRTPRTGRPPCRPGADHRRRLSRRRPRRPLATARCASAPRTRSRSARSPPRVDIKDRVDDARLALGAVASRPWRARAAERVLPAHRPAGANLRRRRGRRTRGREAAARTTDTRWTLMRNQVAVLTELARRPPMTHRPAAGGDDGPSAPLTTRVEGPRQGRPERPVTPARSPSPTWRTAGWCCPPSPAAASGAIDTAPVLAMPGVGRLAPRQRPARRPACRHPPDPAAVFQHDRVPNAGRPSPWSSPRRPSRPGKPPKPCVVTYDQEPHDIAFTADHPGDALDPSSGGRAEAGKGDLAAGLAASAVVVEAKYTTPEEHHSMMEPHAATARWDGGRAGGRRLQPGHHLGQTVGAQSAVLPGPGPRYGCAPSTSAAASAARGPARPPGVPALMAPRHSSGRSASS